MRSSAYKTTTEPRVIIQFGRVKIKECGIPIILPILSGEVHADTRCNSFVNLAVKCSLVNSLALHATPTGWKDFDSVYVPGLNAL